MVGIAWVERLRRGAGVDPWRRLERVEGKIGSGVRKESRVDMTKAKAAIMMVRGQRDLKKASKETGRFPMRAKGFKNKGEHASSLLIQSHKPETSNIWRLVVTHDRCQAVERTTRTP